MKIQFEPPHDKKVHTYCVQCHNCDPREVQVAGRRNYHCKRCNALQPRALIIDPAITWWLGPDREYWHEVSGIFVSNENSEYLFFDRVKPPYGLTVPAGHQDRGETPLETAMRELPEETGLTGVKLKFIATDNIYGDSCRRGSDVHRWHVFAAKVSSTTPVVVDKSEGIRPVWLPLNKVLSQHPTPAMRYLIKHHARAILRAA